MNLELTTEQNAAYIAAVLSANTFHDFIKAHHQYGQLDKAEQCLNDDKEQKIKRIDEQIDRYFTKTLQSLPTK